MSDSAEKQNNTEQGNNVLLRVATAMLFVVAAIAALLYMYKYVVRMQHNVYADNALFDQIDLCIKAVEKNIDIGTVARSDDASVYAYMVAYCCNLVGLSPVVFCHRIIPPLFFIGFVIVYTITGVCLFIGEKRSALSVLTSTCAFIIASVFIAMNGVYSKLAVEGKAVYGTWYGRTVSSVLITPIIFVGLFLLIKCVLIIKNLKKSSKLPKGLRVAWGIYFFIVGVILLVISAFAYAGFSVIDDWKSYGTAIAEGSTISTFYDDYFSHPWLLYMAIGLLIYIICTKGKMWIPILLVCIIAGVCKVPIPLMMVVAYGVGYLCVWDKKETPWQIIAVGFIVGTMMMLGFLDNSSVTRRYDFKEIENIYRLPQDAVDVAEFILSEGDGVRPMSITTYEYMYYAIGQYTPIITCRKYDNDNDNLMDSYDYFREGRESGYTLFHSSKEVTEDELINAEYAVIKEFKEYTLYVQTKWVETDEGWMHTKGLGDEYVGQGWHKIRGSMYYFNESGIMQTGWTEIDGQTYYLLEEGDFKTLWQQIDGNWYYFDENGVMQHDCEIEGYQLGSDGICVDY